MSSSMDLATLPPRPPALPISKTCIYKTVGQSSISVDVYFPYTKSQDDSPIMLFIHGGGWIGGNRSDYSRPMFHEFLSLGFTVTSMDYRLLPETSFSGQQEDIRDIEFWLREQLPVELDEFERSCDPGKIVVVGGSAGAHLALLTPKLWKTSPTAILSMYGPTNFHCLPWLNKGRISRLYCRPCTPALLAEATDYDNPPTELALPEKEKDYQKPRQHISLTFFREAIVSEFLVKGLLRSEDGKLALPKRGSASEKEIDGPLHLSAKHRYPPIYQAIGTSDEIFTVSHVHEFHTTLSEQSIPVETVIIPGAVHAFDVREVVGSEVHRKILKPAVNWVAKWVGKGSNQMA